MPKLTVKSIEYNPPWNPLQTQQKGSDKYNSCTYINEEVCIEAKVKVDPEVSIGKVKIECLESGIEPCTGHTHEPVENSVCVYQLVRIKIPVHFSAKVKTEESGILCQNHCLDD